MEELLEKGRRSLKEDKPSDAELLFSEVIRTCQNQEPRNYVGSRPAFEGMVDVYLKYASSGLLPSYRCQEMLIKATVLCHYVMNVERKCDNVENQNNSDNNENGTVSTGTETRDVLQRIEWEMVKSMNVTTYGMANNVAKHKKALVSLRERMKEEIAKVETIVDLDQPSEENETCFINQMTNINNKICFSLKEIIHEIIAECQLTLGRPPCDYVAIGLGSFAFGTMTPYSDLEWAILLDIEDEQFKDYFRDLSHLLHFKVACLGETIVPSVMIKSLNSEHDSWFYDDVTPRGFAVDGAMVKACKTPLGRRDDFGNIVFELIHSPEKMAEFQNLEWLGKSFELAASLRSFRVIYFTDQKKGDEIIQRYNMGLNNQLECLVRERHSLFSHKEDSLPPGNPAPSCLPKEIRSETLTQVFESRKDIAASGVELRSSPTLSGKTSDSTPTEAEKQKSHVSDKNLPDNTDPKDHEKSSLEGAVEFTNELSNKNTTENKLPRKDKVSLASISVEDVQGTNHMNFETVRSGTLSREAVENDNQKSDRQIERDILCNHNVLSEEELGGGHQTTVRSQHEKKMMANDIPRYHLHDVLCTSDTEGMIYNVKKDLYRQPERLLSILFLEYGIKKSNVYEGLEELQRNGVLSDQVKRNLVVALSIACELRLRAYLEHNRQLEELDIPSSIPHCSSVFLLKESTGTTFAKAKLDRLVRFYRIVLPFLEKVQDKNNVHNRGRQSKSMGWRLIDLDDSSHYQALIYLRLLRYVDARYFSLKAIHENPARAANWQLLARLLEKEGKYDNAFHSLLKSFCIYFAGNDEILSLCQETKEIDVEKASMNQELSIEAWIKRLERQSPDSHQISFLITCFQKMGLNSFFASQYHRAWRYFKIVYCFVQLFHIPRRKDTVPSLFNNIALCLSVAGRHKEAINLLEFMLENSSLSPIQVPKARDNLGNAYFRTGNYSQALVEYRKALKIRRSYYRIDCSAFFVISFVNIGNVLSKVGQLTESTKYFREGLVVIRRIYKNPSANYAEMCYSGIGKNLISLGKHEEALEYCEESVKIARKRLGHFVHKSYAISLLGLGNCYLYLKRFNDAVKIYEESASIFQSIGVDIVDDEDAGVLPFEVPAVYCNLAVALHQLGKSQDALRWLREAEQKMALCDNQDSHPDMGVLLHAKAKILRSQGKNEEAKKLLEKALDIFISVFGGDCSHRSIIATLTDLATLLIVLRQHVTAIDRFLYAIRLLTSDTIPEDAFIQEKIRANKNLGYVHYQLKQIPDALVCYERALTIWKEHGGRSPVEVDPRLILSLHVEAGNAYIRGGKCRQAMQVYEAAVNTPVFISHGVCDLSQVALSLAAMQSKAGLPRKAIESFERAVSLHTETNDDKNDAFVVKCYQNQAALYQTIGERQNACNYSEKALNVQLQVTNFKPHQTTAKILAQLAEAWSYSNAQKALEFCHRSLQMVRELGNLEGLEQTVLADFGFYSHLKGLQEKSQSEQQRLYEEAERSYCKVLEVRWNEATVFNLCFLHMSNSRFEEASSILNSVLEKCGKESRIGLDDRDALLINQQLRERLFSERAMNEVVVSAVVLAYCLRVQCYKAMEDNINALSEASKLERFVSELENLETTDYSLLECTFEALNISTKSKELFQLDSP